MYANTIIHICGRFLIALGTLMLAPLAIAAYYRQDELTAFSLAALITTAIGLFFLLFFRMGKPLRIRDGYILVGLIWTSSGILGGLPFFFSGAAPTFVDAVFESVSGFTTTGATILETIEDKTRGILLWRSLTHWLGGMGIIVLSVAFLPRLGTGAIQLFRAEVPGPTAEKLLPRVKETAKLLWGLYIALTALQTVLLRLAGLNWFEAINHAFATMATGGFSTRNESVAAFGSIWVEVIIIVFMIAAGVNFTLYYYMVSRRWHQVRGDSELRFYLLVLLVFSILVIVNLVSSGTYNNWGEATRLGVFQTVSITTTTGFTTADFDLWPPFARGLMLVLMFFGGSGGSTGGAIKQLRILILLKLAAREFYRLLHPRVIRPIRVGTKVIPEELIHNISGFILLYIMIFVIGGLAVAAMGVDIVSAFSASAASLGNIGPGLEVVGPLSNYSSLPQAAKAILIFCMLMGRLEIYTFILFLILPFAAATSFRRS